ncbi:MAG: SPFH domain-containing protein [Firmicutes bacterium]|nr:SPFH domain-containing protein [Bacillota bacterium]
MNVGGVVGLIIGVVALFLVFMITFLTRYKKAPPDKIMVIFGRVGKNPDGTPRSSKCIHGGSAFVWPVFQAYSYLDLTPMSISVDLRNTLSRQNIRIDVPSRFTVGISTEKGVMQNAAERLRGVNNTAIEAMARDIILGQLRLVVALMDIEEINSDRDKFLEAVSRNVEGELRKIGLRLINVNVTDITDESGYIDALGREAAAKAINDAKKLVAEQDRDGSIGQANAVKTQRIETAEANATAVAGENTAKADIAKSNAVLRQVEAEAEKNAAIAEATAEAASNKAGYLAEQEAEMARAKRETSTLEADVIVKAEIEKRRIELEAEAAAEVKRRHAKGEADAIKMRELAKAEGLFAILDKQAQGFEKIVKAAGGNSSDAVRLMMTDKMEDLLRVQVDAIKNIKIDKVTVWDSGANGKDGTSTSNFISNLVKSVPPLNELYGMVGMELPQFLGRVKEESEAQKAPKAISAPKAPQQTTPAAEQTTKKK